MHPGMPWSFKPASASAPEDKGADRAGLNQTATTKMT